MKISRISLGIAALTAMLWVANTGSGWAAINDCGTDDGTPPGMFNSQCASLGIFTGNQVLGSGFTINNAGNDKEADVEAALVDLGMAHDIMLIGKSDEASGANFTFWDIANNIQVDPATTVSGGWKYTPGNKIVTFLTVKAASSFRIFKYTPAASDGRYSALGLLTKSGNQAILSHMSFWKASKISEPISLLIFAFGLVGMGTLRRRRRTV
ncbi:MAG: PEP-CTERM sorting domain-containing protein [Sphingomonadales bacterium]